MIKKIFREYDIRGLYPQELNASTTSAIAKALASVFKARGARRISIGMDARTHSQELFGYLSKGLAGAGLEVFDIGLVPTPVGYFSVFAGHFDANIMITGSHNPKEYNGFKITIGTDSFFGEDLQRLYASVAQILKENSADADESAEVFKFDILSLYVEYLLSQFSHLKGLQTSIVADCGNGAAGVALEPIVKGLGLKCKILYAKPDGEFPNHHPDPSEKENLKDILAVLDKGQAEIGFGFDGDADRIAVLSKERNIKGDELAYLYSLVMKSPKILGEVKCSQNIYDAIDKSGGHSYMGKTGHSNIKKAMKELGIDLAAEVSGHIFFKERYFGFDDAIYAMLRVLELLAKGIDLDAELKRLPVVYNTDEIKFNTTDEDKFNIINALKASLADGIDELGEILDIVDIDGVRVRFKSGWALARASNTTPVIVMRFEADSKEFLAKLELVFSALVAKIASHISEQRSRQ